MISRRLAIFGALFGLASAAQAQTRSATELPKCDYPDGMKLPSGGEVMSSDWSTTNARFGRFVFGEFTLIYKSNNIAAEGYFFEVKNDGTAHLQRLFVVFDSDLRKAWRDSDEASDIAIRSPFLPNPTGISLAELLGDEAIEISTKKLSVNLDGYLLRVVMAGPTDVIVDGPARMPSEAPVLGFQHRLMNFDIVRRDAQIVARSFRSAAEKEQRGTCKGGGFELKLDCFLTTATVDTFGLADDCWELTTLRRLRDGPMQARADWGQLAQSYNTIAPPIVAAINARPDAPKVWAQTYFTGILPAAIMVQLGLNKLAVWFYKNRVKALMRFTATA